MYQITKQHIYKDARDAYFHGGKTQKEIAAEVGITDRTLRNWIKEGCWNRLRQNANLAPAIMMDMFCSQLVDLQKKIAARPEEKRTPKTKEVDKQNKLLNCIIKMKQYPFDIFKTLAYGINTVSDPIPFTAENAEMEEPKTDPETALSERYVAYEGKKEEKIFQQENSASELIQVAENEINIDSTEEQENNENEAKEEKISAPEKYDSTKYIRKENVKLPSGAIWLQKGDIYDPGLQQIRRMTPDEWDILLGLGLGRRDFEGWCIAMPD